jgi:hypothetical protein
MPEYGEFDGVNSDNAAAAGAVQAGTEQPAGDQNILREKTFNEELRHLVEKVTAHEAPGPETSDIDDVSDEELIRRLHVLFYRAIHLEHAVPPPRSLVELRRVRGRDEDSLINAIHQGLAELSYRAFALLPFNLEKRCFTPAINTITSLDVLNLFVDMYDRMYTEIVEGGKGLLIRPDTIREDVFLRKRFVAKAGQGDDHFYINSLWNLYRPLVAGLLGPESPDPGFRMSPLLIIRLKPTEAEAGAEAVDHSIAGRLAMTFLLYSSEERRRIVGPGGDMLAQNFRCLEYLFMAFGRMRGAACFILTFREFHTAEGRFLFSYFESVLRSVLSGASSVQQIDKNRLAVFASVNDVDRVRKTAARWNDVHGNLGVARFDSGADLNYNGFLNNYIFQ